MVMVKVEVLLNWERKGPGLFLEGRRRRCGRVGLE